MISYERFWKTLKEKGFTQYRLINDYDISSSLMHRFKNNQHVSTQTLEILCGILECKIEDIIEYVPDKK